MKNFKKNKQKVVNLNVDPNDLEPIKCECGFDVFISGVRIKKVSKILSPDGQKQYLNIPVAVCLKCKAVLPEKP